MIRNNDLIRELMFVIEKNDEKYFSKEYDDDQLNYHAVLLIEAKLAYGKIYSIERGKERARIFRLTWEGHEFLAAATESVWEQVKMNAGKGKIADLPFSILSVLVKEAAKKLYASEAIV